MKKVSSTRSELVFDSRKVAISRGEGRLLGCFGGSRRDSVIFGVNG